MKLLINRNIKIQFQESILETLKKMSILYKIDNTNIIIGTQKCTLNEYSMNELFDEVLYEQQINYSNLGGAGCDFCISID